MIASRLVQPRWLVEFVATTLRQEEGQDMIEYALLISLITIVLILIIMGMGPYIRNTFQDVSNALTFT